MRFKCLSKEERIRQIIENVPQIYSIRNFLKLRRELHKTAYWLVDAVITKLVKVDWVENGLNIVLKATSLKHIWLMEFKFDKKGICVDNHNIKIKDVDNKLRN